MPLQSRFPDTCSSRHPVEDIFPAGFQVGGTLAASERDAGQGGVEDILPSEAGPWQGSFCCFLL